MQDDELVNEGRAREFVSRIQKLRKAAELLPSDRVMVFYDCEDDSRLYDIVTEHEDSITNATDLDIIFGKPAHYHSVVKKERCTVGDDEFVLYLTKPCAYVTDSCRQRFSMRIEEATGSCDAVESYMASKDYTTLLATHPRGSKLRWTISCKVGQREITEDVELVSGIDFVFRKKDLGSSDS